MGAKWAGFEIGWIAEACGGRAIGDASVRADRIERDTRGDLRDAVYVAIAGERFDGHAFLRDAARGGAAGAIVAAGKYDPADLGTMAAVETADTIAALGAIARAHRREMDALVLALTGSCGKTAAKEMLASILRRVGPVCATAGNLNNHIGVPLTLLAIRPGDRFAVVEMGCSRPGEIAALAAIAEPDVGGITCVGAAHLEWLRTLEGAAKAKGEIFLGLRPRGIAVVNADDPFIAALATGRARRLAVGEARDADVRIAGVVARDEGSHDLTLLLPSGETIRTVVRLPGRHQASNAALAAAMAHAAGASADAIREGIQGTAPIGGRGTIVKGPRGVTILDDTYNANPTSAAAAIRTLCGLGGTGRKVAILAEMLELGEAAEAGHRSVGKAAAEADLDLLVCVGAHAGATADGAREGGLPDGSIAKYPDVETFLDQALVRIEPGDRVLVKGSRGMRMERVVERLLAGRFGPPAGSVGPGVGSSVAGDSPSSSGKGGDAI